MKKTLIAAALIAGSAVCLEGNSYGHGGTYRGPGDTVPAGGGGSTGGGPATPGTGGPSTPGPGGPSTPGPATPGAPGGAPGGAPNKPSTGGSGDAGIDLTQWQFWWGFNREPYLNLKAAIHSAAPNTGSDEFFLGKGAKDDARDTFRPSDEMIRGRIVPALVQALRTERNNHIVTGCMVALAKIGDAKHESGEAPLAEEFYKFLSDPNQEIAETAALSLGILATDSPKSIQILTHLLQNESDRLRNDFKIQLTGNVALRTRAFSAYGLGLIGNGAASDDTRRTIVTLLAKMADGGAKSLGTRDVPVACIISMGLVPLPIDEAAMGTPVEFKDLGKKARVHEMKNRLDQVMWLMSFYDDKNQDYMVQAHVPRAIAQLMSDVPPSATPNQWLKIEVAKRFLDDISKQSKALDQTKQSCIIALGQLGDCDGDDPDKAIREGLMNVKEDLANQMAKNFAVIALAQASGRPGLGADPVAGLSERKGPRSYLSEQLSKGKGNYKSWSALAIGVMERSLADAKMPTSTEMRSAVRMALREAKSPTEVGALAISAGIMRDEESKETLRDKLDSISDDDARGYAAVGLGLIDDRSAIEPIQAIITKSVYKPDLLKSAAIGLGLLGDKSIVLSLIEMLEKASGLSSQAAISSALGFIGDSRSVEPLITMLQDKQKTDNARGFAAAALGIVADKEQLPWNSKISVNINYGANTSTLTSPEQGTGLLDIL